jgi:hypothetical protein
MSMTLFAVLGPIEAGQDISGVFVPLKPNWLVKLAARPSGVSTPDACEAGTPVASSELKD